MSRMHFISLPVRDVAASQAFYEAIGFTSNPRFADADTACMVWCDSFFAMIMTREKWRTFTDRPIPERGSSQIMLGLACGSREEVDRLAEQATPSGGLTDAQPVTDYGTMYARTVTDPDDHLWELTWFDSVAPFVGAPAEAQDAEARD